MVIGNGLIASAFKEFEDNDAFLFFCSGVSNSTSRNKADYEREMNLLRSSIAGNKDKVFIYFSTCSIEDPSMQDSMYVAHKKEIEQLIAGSCDEFQIFRLSNVVGSTGNRTTVLNFLYDAVDSGHHFELWQHSSRNLIDVEDAAAIVRKILERRNSSNSVINVANEESYEVSYIVSEIERYLGKKGNYTPVDKGMNYSISTFDIRNIIQALSIDFGADYLPRLLEKYYPQ